MSRGDAFSVVGCWYLGVFRHGCDEQGNKEERVLMMKRLESDAQLSS